MATIYVNLDLSTGLNDGTSPENAYQTWPAMVTAEAGTITEDTYIIYRSTGAVAAALDFSVAQGWDRNGYDLYIIGDISNPSIMYFNQTWEDCFFSDIDGVEIYNIIFLGGRVGCDFQGSGQKAFGCIAIGCATYGFQKKGDAGAGGLASYYNCDAVGCGVYGFRLEDYRNAEYVNCYAGDNGTADYYAGTGAVQTLDHSVSSDLTGSAGLQSIAYTTDNFVNVTGGSEDLHLVSGSDLIGAGTTVSGYTTDADGETRDSPPSIGAYEYISSGGGTTYNVSVSDGISFSDASSGNLRIQAAVSDGIALGDSDSGSLAIQAAAADGLSLSDLASALFHFQVVTADGIVLSDQATYGGQIIVSAADGITLSDMAGAALKHLAAITDGIVLSDVVSGVLRYSVNVQDGVSFSDALAAAVKMVLSVSDGVKISDLVVDTTFLPSGKVSITISSRQASITFSSRAPGVGFST